MNLPAHLQAQLTPDEVKNLEEIVFKTLDSVSILLPGQLGTFVKNFDQFGRTWLEQDWVVNLIVLLVNQFQKPPTKAEFVQFVNTHLKD